MNERGEVSLLCSLLILACTSLVLLGGLELRKSYKLLERRTHLYLCAKETRGEIHQYLKFMGRTNWGIRHIQKASFILALIPGAQGGALEAQKLKKLLKTYQNLKLVSYLKMLKDLKKKSCPIDPQLLISPFKINGLGYSRDHDGAARLRKEKWTYYFLASPYLLEIHIDAGSMEGIKPKIKYVSEERGAKLSSLLSSR